MHLIDAPFCPDPPFRTSSLMKNILLKFAVAVHFVCVFVLSANAQIKKIPMKTLELSANAAVFVVGQSAKLTAKAAVKASPILLKATEKTGVFMLKQSKDLMIKAAIPAGRKLLAKYLKYRLMP
jgi:fucose 4-O-acetylase-like acetyltransferase